MAILPIKIYGEPVLKRVASPVEKITDELRKLADDMIETMYDARGIGLAANQIGRTERIVVVDVDWARYEDEGKPIVRTPTVMLNPEVLEESVEDETYNEGCLSLPGITGDVWRPRRIKFRYRTPDWEEIERDAGGLLARCVQHEIDHLNGILFVDRMPKAKRFLLSRQLAKLRRGGAEDPSGAGTDERG